MAKGYKTGGRLRGTPNKVTRGLRAVLESVMLAELENLPALLDQLEPKDKADILVRLANFVMPKIEAVSVELTTGQTRPHVDMRDLSDEELEALIAANGGYSAQKVSPTVSPK